MATLSNRDCLKVRCEPKPCIFPDARLEQQKKAMTIITKRSDAHDEGDALGDQRAKIPVDNARVSE
eukprot:3734350-Amphidinium_carterae.1